MSKFFHTCPACNAHLDPGEVCDCEMTPVQRIKEAWVIGVDVTLGSDISAISIMGPNGEVRNLYGKEAEEYYTNMSGHKIS